MAIYLYGRNAYSRTWRRGGENVSQGQDMNVVVLDVFETHMQSTSLIQELGVRMR
jgi:hypothetical protein